MKHIDSALHCSAHWIRQSTGVACCLLLLGQFAGCSDGAAATGEVRGTVTLDGKPLSHGWVISYPENGPGALGKIGSDGSFELATKGVGRGAVLGKHRLTVVAYEGGSEADLESDDTDGKLLIPQKYTQPGSSGLTMEVSPKLETVIELKLTR